MVSITLATTARPGGLLSVTRPLPEGWVRGVDVFVGSLMAPDRTGPCPVGLGVPQSPGDVQRFTPVQIRNGVICSAVGRPDTESMVQDVYSTTANWALSAELIDGAATGNPALVDAIDLGEVPNISSAISTLEAIADQELFGRLAVIHVPVPFAAWLKPYTYYSEGLLRTVAGNLVAIHGTGSTIYATGEIWAGFLRAEVRSYVDHTINVSESWGDGVGMIAFDPAFNLSVTIGDASSPTSPTSPTSP